ncbi:MAG: TspO/MBR family protein [Clostridium sp.]|uniref:TspO/MBR family protein n=1 Tax=Clostridium sp. TaxID=1506 RepID=UPI002FCBD5BC
MKNIFKVNGNFKLIPLIISLAIPLIGSFLVSIVTKDSMKLYGELNLPTFYPPGWIFGVVWPVLYILMGIAAYRIYMIKKYDNKSNGALVLYCIQLILNLAWPIIFFYFRLYGIAWIELAILILVLIVTFIKFFKLDKISGILLIPYILWCIFALYLNISIWMLNEM